MKLIAAITIAIVFSIGMGVVFGILGDAVLDHKSPKKPGVDVVLYDTNGHTWRGILYIEPGDK